MIKTIKNSICLLMSVAIIFSSMWVSTSAAVASSNLKVNKPVFSYVVESGIRVAKILEISGSLAHGMQERVVGILEKSDGTICDADEVDSVGGAFTLKFVLDNDFTAKTYNLYVNSLNSGAPYEMAITVNGLGTAAAISLFSVSGNSGSISNGAISVTADNVYSLAELVPVFSVTENASVYINDILQESGKSKVNFSNGAVRYKVVSENLATTVYYDVTVTGNTSGDGGGNGGNGGGNGGGSGSGSGSGSGGGIITNIPTSGTGQYETKSNFTDLATVPWAIEYINKLSNAEVISGTGDGRFEPERNLTREEFVKMIVLALGFTERSGITFSDVSKSDWFYPYVDIAYSNGIITGITENEFGVGKLVSREDMATIAHRAMKAAGKAVPQNNTQSKFADNSSISDYAVDAVYSLQTAGIINGVGSNRFEPKGYTQRCAAAKVLCMIMDSKEGY